MHPRLTPLALILLVAAPALVERTQPASRDAGREAATIELIQGEDLQDAINRARPGDTIVLAPGATFTGNFILPAKDGEDFITIRTAEADGQPAAGQRVSPAHAPALAKLQSPNSRPVLRTAPGAHHWRLQLLEFLPTEDGSGEIIALGNGGRAQSSVDQVPRHLVIDRCYIHSEPGRPQKRGITLNSGATSILNSYISEIKGAGVETHAIVGWNGPGPYTIENNYLEAAGVNFMLGGADPAIQGLVAEDVVFRRNHLSKRLEWRSENWVVKNLFELKNARRVLVELNLMENVWRDGQVGFAILLTPRNQGGRAPWSVVEDVTIRKNLVRHAGAGIQILGQDDTNESQITRRIAITDNLFYDINRQRWGGSGTFLQMGNGPREVLVEHNTVMQSGTIITAYGGSKSNPRPMPGLVFRNNIVRHNQFGVHGDNRGVGRDTLQAYFPDAEFTSNAVAGGQARLYPEGNVFLEVSELERQFVNPGEGDFRLREDSRLRAAASDSRDLGADVNAIFAALGLRPRPGSAQ